MSTIPAILVAALAAVSAAPNLSAPRDQRPQNQTTRPTSASVDAGRPRVLLRPSDLPRLKARCGVERFDPAAQDPADPVTFASHTADFHRLLQWVDAHIDLAMEDGGLYLPAFAHLMTGAPGRPDKYTRCIERELARRQPYAVDFDDVIAALDWCWDALEPQTRRQAAAELARAMEPLTANDSPLEHYLFHPRLCHVAAALALRDEFSDGSVERRRIEQTLRAAATYFESTLPQYVSQLHGRAPATTLQSDFEADVVFAAELWHAASGEPYWPRIAPAMRDACDACFWTDTTYPGHFGALMHDFGTRAATVPGEAHSALARGVADVLARRTSSPIAAWYAQLSRAVTADDSAAAMNGLMLRIIHDVPDQPVADRTEAPLARNLGDGWVLMRSDWRPGATVIAFDAGQPIWLSRQHYDAGQFQILRKGRLALDSGDDVRLEAVPARRGAQGIGRKTGEFDLYAQATIAHNCMVICDPRDRLRWRGQDWPAVGNQRLMDGDWKQVSEPIESSQRQTGRLLAFETNAHYSYAAADLAKAYAVRTVLLYDRHLLFVGGRYLFVVDRLVTEKSDVGRTWMLHLPSRPLVNETNLDPEMRRLGTANDAGAWVYPQYKGWLSADGGQGRLYVRTLLPDARRWTLIGGPQKVEQVTAGQHRGRSYVGGGHDTFEYWLTPFSVSGGMNAWFRLGQPVDLGPAFGVGAGWGRLEVEPVDAAAESVMVHLLVPQDRDAPPPPEPEIRVDRGTGGSGEAGAAALADVALTVSLPGRDVTYEVTLTPRGPEPGRVRVVEGQRVIFDRLLSRTVQENAAVPVRK